MKPSEQVAAPPCMSSFKFRPFSSALSSDHTNSHLHLGKSALEVIYSNRDFAKLGARSGTPKLEPVIDVVRMPETKYVLVMETSSSMSRYYCHDNATYI